MTYKLTSVTWTEEAILNDKWPNSHEPAKGWRRARIEYDNEFGHSNIEGTVYFPPGTQMDHIMDMLCNAISTEYRNAFPRYRNK